MASETTLKTSRVQENTEADECCENIPPQVASAAGISKVQVGEGHSSVRPSGPKEPLSESRNVSTPSPAGSNAVGKAMSRVSGLHTALSPILKFLNIGNKGSSPEPSQHGNKPHPAAPVLLLEEEQLPDISTLDDTMDSPMQMSRNVSALPDSVPVTPRPTHKSFSTPHYSHLTAAQLPPLEDVFRSGVRSANRMTPYTKPRGSIRTPLDDKYLYNTEITLLDVTPDSEPSPRGDPSDLKATQDCSPLVKSNNTPPVDLSGQIESDPVKVDTAQSKESSSTVTGNVTLTLSSFSEQSDKSVGGNLTKTSFDTSRDISVGSGSEGSCPNLQNIQKSAEDGTPASHPINVTQGIGASSDMSVQCATLPLSTSEVQCDTSSKNVTVELPSEHEENSNTKGSRSSHGAELTTKLLHRSSKMAASANGTFNVIQNSNLSASSSLNLTAQTSGPQNNTVDLPSSSEDSPKVTSEDKVQATAENTTEMSSVVKEDCLALKAADCSCDAQYATFNLDSLRKSGISANLEEPACAPTFSLQNTTFDKPPSGQNGTITLSETSSSVCKQNTTGRASPPPKVCNVTCTPKVCNVTSSPKASNVTSTPKESNSNVQPNELSKINLTTSGIDPNAKVVVPLEDTFDISPVVEASTGADGHKTKDLSRSLLPLPEVLSDNLGHQSMDTENNNNIIMKANTFNLDDTLDLGPDHLVTSTPMPSCKMFLFNNEQASGKPTAVRKALEKGDAAATGTDVQARPDVPSNIIGDRKTFLPAPKRQLPKYKPTAVCPGRIEPLTTRLPLTRQRTTETAAPDVHHGATGISYNLRSTTGSKPTIPGLRKMGGFVSVQRVAPGLRPPSARNVAPPSSSSSSSSAVTDKLHGPSVTNPATKIYLGKKHPLSRSEALPIAAKKKKMDAPSTSSSAQDSASSCDVPNKSKNLKHPTTSLRVLPAKAQRDDAAVPTSAAESGTSCSAVSRVRALKPPVTSSRNLPAKPPSHGCANCVLLQQEILTLKEELQKYRDCKSDADPQ